MISKSIQENLDRIADALDRAYPTTPEHPLVGYNYCGFCGDYHANVEHRWPKVCWSYHSNSFPHRTSRLCHGPKINKE